MPARGPFQEQLGYSFKQPDLLKLALTHPSVSHEKGKRLANNQRLEFLGGVRVAQLLQRLECAIISRFFFGGGIRCRL